MNVQELALMVDGISRGLAEALKEREKKELAALVGMFRRFPNQTVTEFIRFVEGSFSKERNSVPALVERIKAFGLGRGEPYQELQSSLTKVGAADLKAVLTALGLKPSNRKDANLKLLQAQLANGHREGSTASPEENLARDIDQAYTQYEAMKADLRGLTVEEMRARFAPLANLRKAVLAGLLAKLGYPADGSKEQLEGKLLDNLTSLKISHDQTRQIGS